MSKIGKLKGYLENQKVQAVLKSRGVHAAIAVVAASAICINFIGGNAKASTSTVEEKTYKTPTFVSKEKEVIDVSKYAVPDSAIGKGSKDETTNTAPETNVTPETPEVDDNFKPVELVPPTQKPETETPDTDVPEVDDETPETPEDADGYTEDGYLSEVTEEHILLTVEKLQALAVEDGLAIETKQADTPDQLVELGRVRVPAHTVNGSRFEWEALKQFLVEGINDIVITIEQPKSRALNELDIILSVHEDRYDLNGDGYCDNKYLTYGVDDLGNHLDVVEDRILTAMSGKGYKIVTDMEYSSVNYIKLPMHQYNGLYDFELETVENIIKSTGSKYFNVDVHRKGMEDDTLMWISVYSYDLDEPEVEEPTEPETPVEPEQPSEPDVPEVEEPEQPSEPDVPEVEEPEQPSEPDIPEVEEPEQPTEPEQPVEPEAPNTAPTITVENPFCTFSTGEEFDWSKFGIVATDAEDGALPFEIIEGSYDMNVADIYELVIQCTDSKGLTATATVYVDVIASPVDIYGDAFYRQVESEILRLVNVERAKVGLGALTWADKSHQYSIDKSVDMAENDYFDHLDLNGKYSYHYMQEDGLSFWMWAENIVSMSSSSENPTDIASVMVEMWMNSAGHKANILHAGMKELSVGVYCKDNVWYGTQIFTQNLK